MKNSFICYNNLLDSIDGLSMEQRGMLLTAMLKYSSSGEVCDLDPVTAMAFSFVKTTMDSDAKKYQDRCDQNAENGKKGGRPKKANETEKTERFSKKQTQAKKADNDNDIDNDLKEKLSAKAESKKKVPKHKHGEYGHVMLTDAEHERLVSEYGKRPTEEAIRKVDEYCQSHGKTYTDYNLVLRKWGYENRPQAPPGKRTVRFTAERHNDYESMERALIASQRGSNG